MFGVQKYLFIVFFLVPTALYGMKKENLKFESTVYDPISNRVPHGRLPFIIIEKNAFLGDLVAYPSRVLFIPKNDAPDFSGKQDIGISSAVQTVIERVSEKLKKCLKELCLTHGRVDEEQTLYTQGGASGYAEFIMRPEAQFSIWIPANGEVKEIWHREFEEDHDRLVYKIEKIATMIKDKK